MPARRTALTDVTFIAKVTASATSSLVGTTNPAGETTYIIGELASIQAVPKSGYAFSFWSGDNITDEEYRMNPLVFRVRQNRSVVAHFKNA